MLEVNFENSTQAFLKNGFCIFKNRFEPRLISQASEEIEWVHRNYSELKIKISALHRLGEWSIKNPHLASEVMRDFMFSDPFREIAISLIGSDIDLYWATTAAKPPENGKSFPWHQDVGYEEEPREYITCWTAFDYVDEENGCLWVIPGSHAWEVMPHEFRKSNDSEYAGVFLKKVEFDESLKVPLCLQPGDIACMHSNLVHCTFNNFSNRKRRGLISAYGRAFENQPTHIRGHDEAYEPFLRNGKYLKQGSL